MPSTAIIVPARLASERFPRKLLHPIAGKPLILWTADRLRQIAGDRPIFFAVADEELKAVLEGEGYTALLTDPDLPSGTDRVAVANRELRAEVVLNVQADEPDVTAVHLDALEHLVQSTEAPMATLATRFAEVTALRTESNVKVVRSDTGMALYFSRAPVPWARGAMEALDNAWLADHAYYHHLGLYAYRADFLQTFTRLPAGELEQIEKLEQLRALENGFTIAVGITSERTLGVDTPEDAALFAAQCSTQTPLPPEPPA